MTHFPVFHPPCVLFFVFLFFFVFSCGICWLFFLFLTSNLTCLEFNAVRYICYYSICNMFFKFKIASYSGGEALLSLL